MHLKYIKTGIKIKHQKIIVITVGWECALNFKFILPLLLQLIKLGMTLMTANSR